MSPSREYGSDANLDRDYMHRRYFSAHLGRFLSVDPQLTNTRNPQSLNRYSYGRSNPLKYVDPTGEVVNLASLTDSEVQELLDDLNRTTGNTYGADKNNNLTLVSLDPSRSKTATKIVEDLINSTERFDVYACNTCSIQFAVADTGRGNIFLDFNDFGQIDYRNVKPESFGLGTQFLHEGLHLLNPGLDDPSGRGKRGFFVDQVNRVRAERGLDIRDEYVGLDVYGKVKVFFEGKGLKGVFGIRKYLVYPRDAVKRGPLPPYSKVP